MSEQPSPACNVEMLRRLPPLREVIAEHGLLALKSLGQNFLLDGNITDKVARAAGSLQGMHVVEVGPGPGGLTRSLLAMGAAQVVAIEKDRRCMAALASLVEVAEGRLSVLEADALTMDVTTCVAAPRKIVANLPYNVATPLLLGWLKQIANNPTVITSMTLMFQREVADRLLASPGTKAYGRLSVMCQWLCDVRHAFDLPPSVFTPPPKVTSSVVYLVPHPEPLCDVAWDALEKVVEKAFNQRRKMLRSGLKGLAPNPEILLEAAGINPTWRAEQLTVQDFGRLTQAFVRGAGRG